MPRLICLSAFVLAACQTRAWKYTDHVTLSSGYEHKGVKTVYVRAPQPNNYYDRLALHAMRAAVAQRTNLFRIVENPNKASLDMIVTGRRTTRLGLGYAGVDTGWLGQHFAFARGSLSQDKQIGTQLSMLVVARDEGTIYRNVGNHSQPPHEAMKGVACRLVKMYATGK